MTPVAVVVIAAVDFTFSRVACCAATCLLIRYLLAELADPDDMMRCDLFRRRDSNAVTHCCQSRPRLAYGENNFNKFIANRSNSDAFGCRSSGSFVNVLQVTRRLVTSAFRLRLKILLIVEGLGEHKPRRD